jgi:hypothetical protein
VDGCSGLRDRSRQLGRDGRRTGRRDLGEFEHQNTKVNCGNDATVTPQSFFDFTCQSPPPPTPKPMLTRASSTCTRPPHTSPHADVHMQGNAGSRAGVEGAILMFQGGPFYCRQRSLYGVPANARPHFRVQCISFCRGFPCCQSNIHRTGAHDYLACGRT